MEQEQRIADLIARMVLTGSENLRPEEKEELQRWSEGHPDREALLREFHDYRLVASQLRQMAQTETRRPLAAMRRRIAGKTARPTLFARLKSKTLLAVASILLVAGVAFYIYNKVEKWNESTLKVEETQPSQGIVHGTTRATLSLADGQAVQLGSNAKENKELLSQLGADEDQERRLSTPRGGEFHIVLSDGTEVWLNAGSQLDYPGQFEGEERRVKLSGEAYFKVKHDAVHPFIVEAAGQEVIVHGTEFNIEAYPDERVASTTLVNGSVTVVSPGKAAPAKLRPGEQAVLNTQSQALKVKSVNTSTATSWREGRFIFDNRTLEDIVRELSRWYDFDYTFSDPRLGQTVFMGSVPRYAHFSEVLRILEMSGGIHFQVKGRHVRVVRHA